MILFNNNFSNPNVLQPYNECNTSTTHSVSPISPRVILICTSHIIKSTLVTHSIQNCGRKKKHTVLTTYLERLSSLHHDHP